MDKVIATPSTDSAPTVVYGDEAGNTGPELLDPQQPVFVLAFTDYAVGEAQTLLSTIATNAAEVHLTALLRRRSGLARLAQFFSHPLMEPSRVRTFVINKEYMVVTKVVDLLIENVAHEMNFDLYQDGLNIVMANRIYAVLHELVGPEQRLAFLRSFVSMVRQASDSNIAGFYQQLGLLTSAIPSIHREVCDEFLLPLDFSRTIVRDVLDGESNDKYTLDPIIPSTFSLAYEWAKRHPNGFALVHDEAKTLRLKEHQLRLFMDSRLSGIEVGYDERKHPAQLPIRDIRFAASHEEPSIQVADVVAGVTMRAFAKRVDGSQRAEEDEFSSFHLQRFLAGGIWPTDDYTPEDLGMRYQGGLHPVDAYSSILGEDKEGL
ncbi:DUF3800 domain-containing protein [Rhizobacter sp. J219]|uniref:DUF3800 domain-containing protein n=1 Tax=Rhizobacter sp. J219 TaxID=2898430 RepID=UPI002151554E|nr:DUF3800 domain-containing protein [Rhizobacter sp. J219]MCR5883724.1 DUF3800 domain-containing protein [Rhizobacter sp. J219]